MLARYHRIALPQAARAVTTLIMGPPGGGKGTISKKLIKDFGYKHLSSGDMLRSHVKAGSELGKKAKSFMDSGKLVPDDLLIGMILSEIEVADTDRILLDGFPRTKPQAEALDAKTKIGMALNLQVPSEDIVKRASMRWVHAASGRVYAYDYNPPKVEGKDDETGEALTQRDDDKPETVRARLAVYDEETSPLAGHYAKQGVLREFDGSDHPDLVAKDRRSDAIYLSLKPHVESQLKK